jgi:hypothetical protein
MKAMRALASMIVVLALASCAGAAPQDGSSGDTQPRKVHMPPTGGPLPPERVEDLRCKVDADCKTKRHCAEADAECRCVQDRCVRRGQGMEPVVDPAPTPPPASES